MKNWISTKMGKKTLDFFIKVLDICPTVEYAMKQKYTSCIYHLMQECKKERNGGKSNEKNADFGSHPGADARRLLAGPGG